MNEKLGLARIKALKGAALSIYLVLKETGKAMDIGALAFFTGYGKPQVRQGLSQLIAEELVNVEGEYFYRANNEGKTQ